jgi:RNA polymerase sigma-70 factor (ECF subfamily)
MNPQPAESHLSRIQTMWTAVRQAHDAQGDALAQAQQALIERYSGALYRYALGALKDPHAADEVFQEFAVRFVRGFFKRADPERGRFRDLVKRALQNLIVDYQRKRGAIREREMSEGMEPAEPEASLAGDLDRSFIDRWREELLNRAWEALQEVEKETGQPHYTVLRFRADNPETTSMNMAEVISQKLGKAYRADSLRQVLHRARERFAELLMAEVARSLGQPSREELTQELIDLGLLSYCRSALDKYEPKAV